MRYAVIAIAFGCGGSPAAPISNQVAQKNPCDAAQARSRTAVVASHVQDPERALAQATSCVLDGTGSWAIVIDTLCVVPPISLDNSDDPVTIVGRWLVVYLSDTGASATYRPYSYTGDSAGCIDYSHPGNLARRDVAHLLDATLTVVGKHEVVLTGSVQNLQDHPEEAGTSLGDSRIDVHLTYRAGTISARER